MVEPVSVEASKSEQLQLVLSRRNSVQFKKDRGLEGKGCDFWGKLAWMARVYYLVGWLLEELEIQWSDVII